MVNATQDYWDRLRRISSSAHSRIYRTDCHDMHNTTYNLKLSSMQSLQVHAKTLSMMEYAR
jgi:hypothetical protein